MCLGIPAKLLTLDATHEPTFKTGKVSFGGNMLQVSFALLPDAVPGDYVLVHAGIAISIISEEEANTVFDYLSKNNELDEINPSD